VPAKARFIEPMLLLRTEKLPDGPQWVHELKFDGYRALAIKSGGKVHLRSRNDNDFNGRYPGVVKALGAMPDDTVIDGEVVALDPDGKPSFNLLQNYSSAGTPLHFFIFDVLVLKGQEVMGEPLVKRRELLEEHVFPNMDEPIRHSPLLEASLKDLIQSVKAQGLEGLVAKRRDSKYEPRAALRRVAENARQRRAGTRHRRVHAIAQEFRCHRHRLLPGGQAHVRCTHAERVHAGISGGTLQEAQAAGNHGMPFRKPPGTACRSMGCWAHGGQDGRVSLAEARAGGSI